MSFSFAAPRKARNNRNNPKNLLKIIAGRREAISPPAIEVTAAGITTDNTPSVLKSPLFLCALRLNAAMGRKATRFAACAMCCSTPKNMVRTGIKRVPPPMPMPPKSPAPNPARR